MLDSITFSVAGTPARLVRSGFLGFFAGAVALLLGAMAPVIDVAGGALPAWVPESPLALTAAALLVCWGVWAMGTGLRQARGDRGEPGR